MNDDQFERFVRDAARDYNAPPEVPREAMWDAMQRQRREERQRRQMGPVWKRVHWARWGVGIAAALALGIGIGRQWGDGSPGALQAPATAASEAADADDAELYRFVTAQHLGQVETFLTMFQVDARSGRHASNAGGRARELLTTTRLLLDSPAAQDEQFHLLLEDIELVLAQIAQFSSGRRSEELEFIDDGIDRRSMMFRLQAALVADPTLSGQGAL